MSKYFLVKLEKNEQIVITKKSKQTIERFESNKRIQSDDSSLRSNWSNVNEQDQCVERCNAVPNCKSWSWNSKNTGSFPNLCALKNHPMDGTLVNDNGWYSGNRENEGEGEGEGEVDSEGDDENE